ncbi:hypothetical protein Taro_050765 [Colocasia esculenta]|uniref:Uncharacterized protein n=1 Tax=Colocasia esculenta TaxID=4460 RepID=A0A843XF51_COLES|nr:hypothetical protein [Colocasia esculenta]
MNFAPDRKSPSTTFFRPSRSANSELGPRGWFRPPGEQISVSDRRVRRSVYYNALSGAEFRPRNGIPQNQRPIDHLGVGINYRG